MLLFIFLILEMGSACIGGNGGPHAVAVLERYSFVSKRTLSDLIRITESRKVQERII